MVNNAQKATTVKSAAMNLDQPIAVRLMGGTHSMRGNYYANVLGVHPRASVGVYFNAAGEVIACTIYDGKDAQALLSKLHAEVARRGIEFPKEEQ
jgi:hypothetical protein